jgi:hypothetical protein
MQADYRGEPIASTEIKQQPKLPELRPAACASWRPGRLSRWKTGLRFSAHSDDNLKPTEGALLKDIRLPRA